MDYLSELKKAMLPQEANAYTDDFLESVIGRSVQDAKNRLYAFQAQSSPADLPDRYNFVVIRRALEILGESGAEGENSHSEVGISRSWFENSSALQCIIPIAFVG